MPPRTRRALLASAAAGLAGLAGCADEPPGTEPPDDDTTGPPGTATDTPTPTPSGSVPEPVDLDEPATRWAVRFDGPVLTRPAVRGTTVVVGEGFRDIGTPEPTSNETWTLAALDASDGVPVWTNELPAPTFDQPVVAGDGVYVQTGFSTGYTGTAQHLLKVAGGTREWAADTPDGLNSLLAVDDAGRAYVGTGDDAISGAGQPLLAVDGDGDRAWTRESGDAFGGRLVEQGLLVDVGSIAIEVRDTADGSQRWRTQAGVLTEPDGSIPVVADTVFGSREAEDGRRFAGIDLADGGVRWTYDDAGEAPFVASGATVVPEIAIGASHDDLVVGTEHDGVAFGLSPLDGSEVWRFETDGDTVEGPVADGERVFLGDTAGIVYALDATDGSELWRTDIDDPVASVAVAGDALVARTGKGSDRLVGLAVADGTVEWSFETDENLTPPVLGDDVVVVGSESGLVRALGT